MFVLVRALTYSTLFIGLLLVFLPARILSAAGVIAPASIGAMQIIGMTVAAVGAVLSLSCIFTFVFSGKGTPAPFDPPKRLVVRGPYKFVRNPMYVGAGLALAGAAVFYRSFALIAYMCALFAVTHALVLFYEEPILTKQFGRDYEAYRLQVRRWLPRLNSAKPSVQRRHTPA